MTHNPYQAPDASVGDPVIAEPVRPAAVSLACRIFWVVLVLGLLSLLPAIRGEWWLVPEVEETGVEGAAEMMLIGMSVFIVIASASYALLTWLISRRHNWARWTMLAYLAFGWYVTTGELSHTFSTAPLAGVLDLLCLLAEVWAAGLLFFGAGARWFKPSGTP